jgi:DNA adenine methylase
MTLKPFLKWAGGKRWLFDTRQLRLPEFTGCYFEPFLGGGAAFFANRPSVAVLSDTNQRLIEVYVAIRDSFDLVESILAEHQALHGREYYYYIREKQYADPMRRAAQFLYLNRTCWNGLYRENLKGKFNVPIGSKQAVLLPDDNFEGWSRALRGVHLKVCDFEESIDQSKCGDFVFVDPPYTVRHNNNGFVKYNQNIFAWEDQVRLRDALLRAADRGVAFVLTNADHASVRELYSGFGSHRVLVRHSKIASRAENRSVSTELLVSG